ncbi:Crp/Fnr family transcriptional regulator [uncultured Sphingomonas sp.]|uniref:Crp/Fnr family transcriptional regulator n=1 Tax=uncultured Sphingomonas sp. TaxID=158754 RepID=UPI00260148B6|nr:Crp/Fnr family transcriptional regulator [uncultured Sphingomonas sp.]
MIKPAILAAEVQPAMRRLDTLTTLDDVARSALATAFQRTRFIRARRELLSEGAPITESLLVLKGWAARIRLLADGRRQIMSLMLPGDLIGNCHHARPVAMSSVIALTDVEVCIAPSSDGSAALAEAYALSHGLDEAYLLATITRLGRLNAEERITDLFLELLERLGTCGLADQDSFALPLTQEMLADAVGLTPVHVNRTLQILRRREEIVLKGGQLVLSDPVALALALERNPVRITWDHRRNALAQSG